MRFVFLLLSYISGFLGIGIGIFVYMTILCNLKSLILLKDCLYIYSTSINSSGYFLEPIWRREKRADYLNTKKEKSQNHISMKWRYK